MLKKSERLSKKENDWLLKKGDRFSNEFFSIKFHVNQKPFCRFSIVISKKVLKLAVKRNYIRRQFYEILQQRPASKIGCDFSILVRPAIIKLDFNTKKEKLLFTINKILTSVT